MEPAQQTRPLPRGHGLKHRKKNPFLEAYIRHGHIGSAAKAVGISRFAVIDWRKNDPEFARAFNYATRLARSLADQVHERVSTFKTLWSKLGTDSGGTSRRANPTTTDCPSPVGSIDPSLEPSGAAACGVAT